MSKGSTWHIWDFHIHSPFSVLNNSFGDYTNQSTWDAYFQKLAEVSKEKNISALGITDYFSIDGYRRVRSHCIAQQKEAEQNHQDNYFLKGIFVFPNVEFRILPSTSQNRPINLHLLFSPEIVDELDDKLFSRLTFVYKDATFNCLRTDLIRLGKKYSNSDSLPDNKAYEIGVGQFKITVDSITKVLNANVDIRKNTVIAVANSNNDGASGIQHSSLAATRENIYYVADCIFSANPNDRDYFLGQKSDTSAECIHRYGRLKPCIHGSDSHELNKIGIPNKERYCWLKCELSWEGLKQIIYEPEDRVKIHDTNPEHDKSIYTLSKVKIASTKVNSLLRVDEWNAEFNSNLITIIGGRGSGKTALLDILASCFRTGEKLREMENSFFHRLYAVDKSNQPISTIIEFRSGEVFKKNIGANPSAFFEKTDILYLTQNHFDEYTENPGNMYKHIIDLVFNEYPDERLSFDKLGSEIKDCEQAIQAINLGIEQLRSDISSDTVRQVIKFQS